MKSDYLIKNKTKKTTGALCKKHSQNDNTKGLIQMKTHFY